MANPNSENAPGQNKSFSIVVNGRPRTITQQHLTYTEVVKLAFPDAVFGENIVYTVAYSFPHGGHGGNGGHDGSLTEGEKVPVKEGMVFNVGRSDKS